MWLEIDDAERELVQSSLKALLEQGGHYRAQVQTLCERLERANHHPDITVGVHGGVIQWVLGNPFPIRICDYDGESDQLPDVDERGQKCNMWLEPPSA